MNRHQTKARVLRCLGNLDSRFRVLVPAGAHFHRHGDCDSRRHRSQNIAGKLRIAHHGRAAGLSANHASWATKIHIDHRRTAILRQCSRIGHLGGISPQNLHHGKMFARIARVSATRHFGVKQMRTRSGHFTHGISGSVLKAYHSKGRIGDASHRRQNQIPVQLIRPYLHPTEIKDKINIARRRRKPFVYNPRHCTGVYFCTQLALRVCKSFSQIF